MADPFTLAQIGLQLGGGIGGIVRGTRQTAAERRLRSRLEAQAEGRGSSAANQGFRQAAQEIRGQAQSDPSIGHALAQRNAARGLADLQGEQSISREREALFADQQLAALEGPDRQRIGARAFGLGGLANTLGTQLGVMGQEQKADAANAGTPLLQGGPSDPSALQPGLVGGGPTGLGGIGTPSVGGTPESLSAPRPAFGAVQNEGFEQGFPQAQLPPSGTVQPPAPQQFQLEQGGNLDMPGSQAPIPRLGQSAAVPGSFEALMEELARGRGAITSDINVKSEINDARAQIDAFMQVMGDRGIASFRAPDDGGTPRTGVMAQDLQQSEVGNNMVSPNAEGNLQIDAPRAVEAVLASVARLNERLGALESPSPSPQGTPAEEQSRRDQARTDAGTQEMLSQPGLSGLVDRNETAAREVSQARDTNVIQGVRTGGSLLDAARASRDATSDPGPGQRRSVSRRQPVPTRSQQNLETAMDLSRMRGEAGTPFTEEEARAANSEDARDLAADRADPGRTAVPPVRRDPREIADEFLQFLAGNR